MIRYAYLASVLLLQLAAGQDEALLALEAVEEATPTPPPEFTCPVKVPGANPSDITHLLLQHGQLNLVLVPRRSICAYRIMELLAMGMPMTQQPYRLL